MTLHWQILLPISLSARLIKYIIGLLKDFGVEFCNLVELTQEKIKNFLRKSVSKSCEINPLPAVFLKGYLTILLPAIASIINLSLSTGVMPDALKLAILWPILIKVCCWLWTVPKLSSFLELKSSIEACWKGTSHTTYRSRRFARRRWDVSVCI